MLLQSMVTGGDTPQGGGVVEGRTRGMIPRAALSAWRAVDEATCRPSRFSDPQFDHAGQTRPPHGHRGYATRLELARKQEIRSGKEDRAGGVH